jgi:RES domain-containing protein
MSMPSAAASEKKSLEGIPVVRAAFPRTVRLVTTARLRDAVLRVLVDSDQERAELEEIESATSARLIAQAHGIDGLPAAQLIHGIAHAAFINASFAYTKPRELNRFNGPDRGAWYAALAVETSIVEVSFHMAAFLERAGDFNAVVDYAELFASLAGEYCDLRKARNHPALNPDPAPGYSAGNALARIALKEGVNGFIYPSVRHKGGTCFAVLWPHAVQSVAQGGVFRLTWSGASTPQVVRISR